MQYLTLEPGAPFGADLHHFLDAIDALRHNHRPQAGASPPAKTMTLEAPRPATPPAEIPRYYPLRKATDRASALAIFKAKTCPCVRKSFAGIRWQEGGEERRMTWAEVDGA